MLWQLVLIALLIWILTIRWRNRGKRQLSKLLPSDVQSLPLLGISHKFIGSDEDRMKTMMAVGYDVIKNGGLGHIWLGHRFYLLCADAVDADFILKHVLEKDDVLKKIMRLLMGNGSIIAPVSIWRPRRKVLASTFALKTLNEFVSIFAERSTAMVEKLAESAGKGTFSIWDQATSYTMESVCQTTLGEPLETADQKFLKSVASIMQQMALRGVQPWFHSDFVYKLTPYYKTFKSATSNVTSYVTSIIKKKRQTVKSNSGKKTQKTNSEKAKLTNRSFLELLIESSGGEQGYSDLELREETMVMLLAGTDTSAVGISFTAVILSKFPKIQEKVYEELREVLGDSDRQITAEDLPRLKYLDAVVKETLRLYPPVPVTTRKTDKETILPSGIKLEANIGIVIGVWALHRNPKYWGGDAEMFRPERFFDNPPANPAAYIPFSYGPRNCLGHQYAIMSMKTALATLLRRYQILPSENNKTTDSFRLQYNIMLRDVDNFELQLVSRK